MKEFARNLIRSAGFRITRTRPASRFDAMHDTLLMLRNSGFRPSLIIDGGANVGSWTTASLKIFPSSRFHLIEPQPGCAGPLHELCKSNPAIEFHPFAISGPGVTTVHLLGTEANRRGTGAYVPVDQENLEDAIVCAARSLDELLLDRIGPADRVFLKLDLEGHELLALSGASGVLAAAEAVLLEVRFFDISPGGRPQFADALAYMRQSDFELYDIAALSARPRDWRLRTGDVLFIRRNSDLHRDVSWT